ncbi:hypothetical protein JTB14_036226 [Gonioctena quinquepunctata]|nr:hypothetical protein JTB14_036226 [Gonioctena quinquepunctata]
MRFDVNFSDVALGYVPQKPEARDGAIPATPAPHHGFMDLALGGTQALTFSGLSQICQLAASLLQFFRN